MSAAHSMRYGMDFSADEFACQASCRRNSVVEVEEKDFDLVCFSLILIDFNLKFRFWSLRENILVS